MLMYIPTCNPSQHYHCYTKPITTLPVLHAHLHNTSIPSRNPSQHYHSHMQPITTLPLLHATNHNTTIATRNPSQHYHSPTQSRILIKSIRWKIIFNIISLTIIIFIYFITNQIIFNIKGLLFKNIHLMPYTDKRFVLLDL